jgi:hypothetical protein
LGEIYQTPIWLSCHFGCPLYHTPLEMLNILLFTSLPKQSLLSHYLMLAKDFLFVYILEKVREILFETKLIFINYNYWVEFLRIDVHFRSMV